MARLFTLLTLLHFDSFLLSSMLLFTDVAASIVFNKYFVCEESKIVPFSFPHYSPFASRLLHPFESVNGPEIVNIRLGLL